MTLLAAPDDMWVLLCYGTYRAHEIVKVGVDGTLRCGCALAASAVQFVTVGWSVCVWAMDILKSFFNYGFSFTLSNL